MVKRLPEFHHWDHYLFDVNHPNAWNNAGLVWRVSRPKLWSLSSKWCCLGFPRWWRKTRFPNGFPYWMDGWSLILGHWGYVNAYVLLNLWFFHAWLIGWFILAFFVFLETVDVLLRFPSWIFLNFYLICTFDRHFLLKPVKDKKSDGFFSLQDFQLQLLQLRSVSWYFPTKKRDFFLSATIFVVGFKSQTSGKTLGNSSWVFCSLVVFFGGGWPTSISPPPSRHVFGLPKKNSWERYLYYENFGKTIEKSWLRKFHQWTWVVSLCPAEVGFDGKETVPRSYVTTVFRGWWVFFNPSKDGSGCSKKQDLDPKSSKMMRLNFARANMITTSTSKLWMLVFCLVFWVFQDEKNEQTKASSVFKFLTRVIWANCSNQTAGWLP